MVKYRNSKSLLKKVSIYTNNLNNRQKLVYLLVFFLCFFLFLINMLHHDNSINTSYYHDLNCKSHNHFLSEMKEKTDSIKVINNLRSQEKKKLYLDYFKQCQLSQECGGTLDDILDEAEPIESMNLINNEANNLIADVTVIIDGHDIKTLCNQLKTINYQTRFTAE